MPRASISGGMAARKSNPTPATQRTVGVPKRNLAKNQAIQQQQAAAATAAKFKFNANARNQPEGMVAGGKGIVGADRAQVMQVW